MEATFEEIKNEANERISFIFESLDIDTGNINVNSDKIYMPCPVHGGDKPNGFVYDKEYRNWTCWTRNCHENGNDVFSLVCKIFENKFDKKINRREAILWVAGILGLRTNFTAEFKNDNIRILNKQCRTINKFRNNKTSEKLNIPIEYFIQNTTDDTYFKQLGFSQATIDKFLIRFCDNKDKELYNRSIVPILDNEKKIVIAITGRINLEKCSICNEIHYPDKKCHEDGGPQSISKWIHSGKTSDILYNLWNCKDQFNETRTAVLVEGPKNVWVFDRLGISSLGLLGNKLTMDKIKVLLKLGITKIIQCLDHDEAGIDGTISNHKNYNNLFKFYNITFDLPDGQDVADAKDEFLKECIVPKIRSIMCQS